MSVAYGPLVYPGGSVPYLYGSSILRYIEDRYGPEKVREISHRYADDCISGGINRVALQAVGRPYTSASGEDIWNDWGRSASHRYALQKEEAERRGLTTARRLTYDAPAPRGTGPRPVFFRDGTLVYQRDNNDQRPAYVRLNLATGARESLAPAFGGGPASPTPGRARTGLPAPQLHPARLAHLRQRAHQLERPLPPRHRQRLGPAADARLPRARTRRLARRHADRVCRGRRARAPARAGPDRRRQAARARPGGARPRLHAGVFARRAAHRLLALEAGRVSRHPPLRHRRRNRSRAHRRSRDGRGSALHARRALPALGVRPDRHLRRLRVRARDRAALSGDQRALRGVPAGRLDRRQPAGVQRLHDRRHGSVRDAVRSQVVPAGGSRSRTRAPTVPPVLDGDSDSPDSVVGASRAADDHADDQLQALEVHVPAKLGAQLLLRGAGAGPARGSSARRSPIRSATTSSPQTCWSRGTATRRSRSATRTRACSRRSTSPFGAPPSACRA